MAKDETALEEVETEETEAPAGGRKKLFLIAGLGLVVLLAGGAGTFLVLSDGDGESESSAAKAEEPAEDFETLDELPPLNLYQLDPVIVNVAEGQRDRYLKARIELELTAPEVGKEVEARLPVIRDLLIGLLSAQQLEGIRTLEGKNRLREDIQVRLNSVLRTGKVRRVLLTEFVVQ